MEEEKKPTAGDASKTSDGLRVESVKMKLGDVNVEVEGANVTLRFRSEEIAGGVRGALEEGSLGCSGVVGRGRPAGSASVDEFVRPGLAHASPTSAR